MSEKTLVERLEAASWNEAFRADANRALESGAPSYIIEEIEAVARLCGEAALALTQAQAMQQFTYESLEKAQARCAEARRMRRDGNGAC